MKVKSERKVAQSCRILSDPMDCSLPDSSVHGIFQSEMTPEFQLQSMTHEDVLLRGRRENKIIFYYKELALLVKQYSVI